MLHPNPSITLHQLLDESLHFPAEYGAGFSNHLPMALVALHGIGADDARLLDFMDAYGRRFAGTTAKAAVRPVDDWRTLLGRFEAFDVLQCTFACALHARGRDIVLRDALNFLITDLGAAAFHGAIRVAYAIESNHLGELATALAYWAARRTPLAAPHSVQPDLDNVADWLETIDRHQRDTESDCRSHHTSIDARMHDATRTSAYQVHAGRLRVGSRNVGTRLCELALESAKRYAATRNFTLLHIATAARATRVLLPWLPRRAGALDPLWHAVAAASISARMDLRQAPPAEVRTVTSWEEILRIARNSNDEHVIKVVHAMATQNREAPDLVWLQAAAAAVEALALATPASLPPRS